MKKNLLFAALAITALASCTSDEFVGDQSPQATNGTEGAISFTSGTPAVTRASGADAALVLDYKFKVYGVKKKSTTYSNVFALNAYSDASDYNASPYNVWSTQAYRPLMPPIERPVTMKEVFPWLLGLLLLVIAGFVLRFFLKHRKPKVDENGEPVTGPSIPPYDKAIDDLANLRQQKLWQAGKVKEYYSSLTDIARDYIEGQFDINAVEMTTDDILKEVRELRFNEQLYGKLKETMEVADLVKFAKYTTSSLENDQAMNDMTDFVNESYAHYQDKIAKEEEEARQHV